MTKHQQTFQKFKKSIRLQIRSLQLGSTHSWYFGKEQIQPVETFQQERILQVKENVNFSSKKRIFLHPPSFEDFSYKWEKNSQSKEDKK